MLSAASDKLSYLNRIINYRNNPLSVYIVSGGWEESFTLIYTTVLEQFAKQDLFSGVIEVCAFTYQQSWESKFG